MEGCRLLYFVKSKNGTKCKNFAVLLCFYVNTFILLYFLRWQKGGATAPLATPLNPPLQNASKQARIVLKIHAWQIIQFGNTKMPFITSLVATSNLLYRLSQRMASGANVQKAKTGKRFMKQYREKFVQYFPTVVAELTQRKLFESGLKDTSEHLKEVSHKYIFRG